MPIMLEDNQGEVLEKRRPAGDLELQSDSNLVHRQRRQMLIALFLVVFAIVLLLAKNWQSLFPTTASTTEPERLEHSVWQVPAETPAPAPTPSATASLTKPKSRPTPPAPAATQTQDAPAAVVATDRAVLPPLEVEVVAGRQRKTVRPGNTSVKLDMQSDSDPAPAETAAVGKVDVQATPVPGPVVNAGEQVRLSRDTLQVVSRPVDPNYPLLAKQMKVQGAVILQAMIGRGGNIEDLHVLSGPAILSSAAMEAVKQWRFRPYYMQGEAVETQARITVNFTISTY